VGIRIVILEDYEDQDSPNVTPFEIRDGVKKSEVMGAVVHLANTLGADYQVPPEKANPVGVAVSTGPESAAMGFFLLPESGVQRDLMLWWMTTAYEDFMQKAPKVDEYGAHDLEIMGAILMVMVYKHHLDLLREAEQATKLPVATELAVWFYILGKVARLVSDYMAGRSGKPDTWHDITFYSMMARRIQETGRWP
jgi:hypothetical protein